ncbi:MAG: AraC family transcriptional regulator [Mitsuokella sp.]
MKHDSYNEILQRGRFDFPIAFYYVDRTHPRFYMPYHWHMEFEILHIIQGRFVLSLNEQTVHAEAGDVVFIRDGIIHGGHPDSSDCLYECVVFDLQKFLKNDISGKERIDAVLSHELRVNNYLPHGHSGIQPIVELLFHAIRDQKNGYEFLVLGMLYAFFGVIFKEGLCHQPQFSEQEQQVDRQHIIQIKRALHLIDERYAESISLDDMADAAGLSPNYFCKFFKRMTHRSPIEYLTRYRIEMACTKLKNEDAPITAIAYDCGFHDVSYFIKTFRRYKKISPGKFRKADLRTHG